ncbi:hypothetical protein Cni_G00389 [Canna indica]|uniref:Uncharacterized protein n=1 Tax=Canna indica TaxID=4628 RepID=A0AAQ3JL16_9LILI|nr:hypothetical protein Cni_G00389 [Canna indica]
MPNPWKKLRAAGGGSEGGGVSRLLAGLRPPEKGGSLVVQTGFPTSLADIVVKNRCRLKKNSRKKKAPPSDLHSYASGPVASAASSSPSPSGVGPPPGATFVDRPVPVAVGSSPSHLISAATGGTGRRGIGLLLPVMVVLVVLAIERKKLVIMITLSAFALRLLDSRGLQVLRFLQPCSDAKRTLNSVVKVWDLRGRGIVSPIREVSIGTSSDTLRSERSSVESIDAEQGKEIVLERSELVGVGKVCIERNLRSKGNSKAKKLLQKLVPKKFRRQKVNKDGEELNSDSRAKGVSDVITEVGDAINGFVDQDDAELSGEDVVSINTSLKVTDHMELFQEDKCETKSRSSELLVIWIVVLLGLIGGKSVALVLTISWCLLHKSIESLWKKGMNLFV